MSFGQSRSLQQQEPAGASAHIHARIPTLDGWRAVAIFAVICFHGRYVFFPGPSIARTVSEYGYLGVDAFFAISGFLICTLLIREYTANQDIDLKAFYIRRFFRIIPPYLAALAGIGLVAWLGFIHLQSWELPSCLLFLRNYEPTVAPPGGPYDPLRFLYRPFLVALARGTLLPDMGALVGVAQASPCGESSLDSRRRHCLLEGGRWTLPAHADADAVDADGYTDRLQA